MSHLQVARADLAGVRFVARLRLDLATAVDPARVPAVLGSSEARWLGEPVPRADRSVRTFLCDLELHAGGTDRALFRKAAVVSFGQPRQDGAAWVVPIEWRAATLTPLFPVLAGHLRISHDGIQLDGRYAPPGGRLGYVLDLALLGAAARQTGRCFLRRLASALG